jgi:hypothetical protein
VIEEENLEVPEDEDEEIVAVEVEVVTADLDDLGKVVREKFEEAKDFRQDFEDLWEDAYDAYRGQYPSRLDHAAELASERGLRLERCCLMMAAFRLVSRQAGSLGLSPRIFRQHSCPSRILRMR